MLRQWTDESYRALAPEKLVAELGLSAETTAPAKSKPAKRRAR
jgi:hypothetical protein